MRLSTPEMEPMKINTRTATPKPLQYDLTNKKEIVPNLLVSGKEDIPPTRQNEQVYYHRETPFTMPPVAPHTNIFAPPPKMLGRQESVNSSITSAQQKSNFGQKTSDKTAKRVPLSEVSRGTTSSTKQQNPHVSKPIYKTTRRSKLAAKLPILEEESQQTPIDHFPQQEKFVNDIEGKRSTRDLRKEAILTLSQELEKMNEEDSELEGIVRQHEIPEEAITATSYADESSAALSRYSCH